MPQINIIRADDDGSVRVGETRVGKGVFAARSFPVNAVIGEITGEVIVDCPRGSDYSFEIDDRTQLEPHAPFRFLNHSCEPNCEFDWIAEVRINGVIAPLYLTSLRDILRGEELTIDYNWPASAAIPCQCVAPSCRGWIVSADQLDRLPQAHDGGWIESEIRNVTS